MSEFDPAPADPTQPPAAVPSGSDEHAEQPETAGDARAVAGADGLDADDHETADRETGDQETGDRADRVRTGHPASDAVLESLDGLDQRPVHEHVAVFEKAHEDLRSALSQAHGDAAS